MEYNFNSFYPEGFEEFVGLYPAPGGKFENKIIRRSKEPNGPFQFITDNGGPPHFINNPIAWCPLPRVPQFAEPVERALSKMAAGDLQVPQEMWHRLELQKREFDTLDVLVAALKAMPAVVDDDYPLARHFYDAALRDFLTACANNGRLRNVGKIGKLGDE